VVVVVVVIVVVAVVVVVVVVVIVVAILNKDRCLDSYRTLYITDILRPVFSRAIMVP